MNNTNRLHSQQVLLLDGNTNARSLGQGLNLRPYCDVSLNTIATLIPRLSPSL